MMRNSKVHIYTGSGKGKTTAALGLCLRAAGHGITVLLVQFRKGMESGEHASVARLGIPLLFCGAGRKSPPCAAPCPLLVKFEESVGKEQPDIIVLDEIMAALKSGCVTTDEVIAILDKEKGRAEVVLTGREAPAELLARADLITLMEPRRHYYQRGIEARKGVEY